jgi:hypothetical protein
MQLQQITTGWASMNRKMHLGGETDLYGGHARYGADEEGTIMKGGKNEVASMSQIGNNYDGGMGGDDSSSSDGDSGSSSGSSSSSNQSV